MALAEARAAGAGWAAEARASAAARLAAMGLPGRRDEYWRYTPPDALTAEAPLPAPVPAHEEPAAFGGVDRLTLVFVDGVFDAAASDPIAGEGLEVLRLAEVADEPGHWAGDLFGRLEAAGQLPVPRPLAALNTARAQDGVVIRATRPVSRPVALVYRRSREAAEAVLHHLVRVESGASLTLLESGPAAARFSMVLEADIADGGGFHHVRIQGRDHLRRAATHIFARLGAKSLFKSFTLTVNGVLTRNECVVDLTGEGAVAHVAGAAVGDGDFHHDDTIFVTHGAPGCESRQVFKKVLRHGATGVFQGKILVRQPAQQTDGYQISQGLLLDEESRFLAKPELEIYADDVKCSHGSTAGALDETALFYLRSRGLQQADAQDLLVLAFLAQAIEEIEDEGVAADIRQQLEGWLARRRR